MRTSLKISQNYALDLEILTPWKNIVSGITPFSADFDICYDKAFDHTPSITFFLVVANIKIIDFSIYNINHKEDYDL